MRRKDETPPEDHWKRRFPELEAELLDTYYRFKGWNEQGIPTQKSLNALGLDYVAEDFLKRGILTENEVQSDDATGDEVTAEGGAQ
jgi:benzoyl-CoA reductase subunit BamB